MLHRQKNDLMTEQMKLCQWPLGSARQTIKGRTAGR